MKKIFFVLISVPKTLYFNILTFGLKGIKLPVLISYKTKITSTFKNAIKINTTMSPFMIKYGYGGSKGIISMSNSEICLEKGSQIIFEGSAQFAEGISIRNSGILKIGDKFSINKNGFISCYRSISFGDNVTSGWNVCIRDSDGHYIIKNGEKKELFSPVIIENKIWICSYAHILKGVIIKDNSVVAYKSLVTKPFLKNNVMLGGVPAKIIQEDIDWEY